MTTKRKQLDVEPRRQETYPNLKRGSRSPHLPPVAEQKAKYLEGFAEYCTITGGCKAANVAPETVYVWREMDDEFVIKENQLRLALTDRLEQEAIRRALEGWDRPIYQRGELVGYERVFDGSLLKMLLAAYRPDKFRENINVSGTVEQVVRQVAGFNATEVL
jgi:hypothetical protein